LPLKKDALLPNKSVSISSNSFIVIMDSEANGVQYEFRLSSLLFRWLPAVVSMPSKQTDEISEAAEHKVLHYIHACMPRVVYSTEVILEQTGENSRSIEAPSFPSPHG
jgi:hypothetical protein